MWNRGVCLFAELIDRLLFPGRLSGHSTDVISYDPVERTRETLARDPPLPNLDKAELRATEFSGIEVLMCDRISPRIQHF